jgi:hypothetical protein
VSVRGRGRAIVAAALILMFVLPASAQASHSVPSPKWWWDHDNDGVVDPADRAPGLCKAGTWTSAQSARITEAIATWNAGTDFKPALVGCGRNQIYVDGTGSFAGEWGYTDVWYTIRATYVDIHETDVFLNSNVGWYWLADPQPPLAQNMVSGKGVLTHELGHVILLKDLSCSPGATMCGTASAFETKFLSTLTADDVAAANAVY